MQSPGPNLTSFLGGKGGAILCRPGSHTQASTGKRLVPLGWMHIDLNAIYFRAPPENPKTVLSARHQEGTMRVFMVGRTFVYTVILSMIALVANASQAVFPSPAEAALALVA